MSYQIDHTDKPNYGSITVEDQTVNVEKSIGFVGKNYTGYSKVIAENFLHLLESFASATAPTNPVAGQLWYDTEADVIQENRQPQLKVWDSTNWVPAGNVKKSGSPPLNAVKGDLWSDSNNQQLYLYSGSNWVLVGPQFSEGTLTGPKVETVYDTGNASHVIINFYVSNRVIVIFSKDEFIPKLAIQGFTVVKRGINVTSTDDSGVTSTLNKLWGTAEKADALVVAGRVVTSDNFLRSDVPSTSNSSLSIRNNLGLVIGADLATSLTIDNSGAAILYNKNEGSSILIRTNQGGTSKDALTISGTNIGINKTNPIATLDVVGNIQTNDQLVVTGTTNAVDLNTGSIKTAGGASITKNLYVGTGATITGQINSNSIIPITNSAYDLGSSNSRYRVVYGKEIFADTFFGSFSGQLAGSVSGSASKLASSTAFSLTGDVASNTINFNGQQPSGLATFNTTITADLINAKIAVATTLDSSQLLVNIPSTGLRKITKSNFLSNAGVMPAGVILPFAGSAVPNGFVLCDGSEQLISAYPTLFAVIGYTYKSQSLLQGAATFCVPDLRGRFALGADNMNNGTLVPDGLGNFISTTQDKDGAASATANRVTDVTADVVGVGNGSEELLLNLNQLPEHKHDLRGTTSTGDKGNQYYAIRNTPDAITDVDAVPHTTNGPDSLANGQYLTNSGGVDSPTLGQPVNKMNPYLTINYIIFTGTYV
jgi:microcystin-dependent protein